MVGIAGSWNESGPPPGATELDGLVLRGPDESGRWVAVWDSLDALDGTIGADSDILVARSTDNGATWTQPAPLNTNAASDSSGDINPDVATDGAGNWLAVWRLLGGTNVDILVARSTDGGATWTPPALLAGSRAGSWERQPSTR